MKLMDWYADRDELRECRASCKQEQKKKRKKESGNGIIVRNEHKYDFVVIKSDGEIGVPERERLERRGRFRREQGR